MENNKGWLYLKRAFVLLMGTLLVWQTFGTDVTYAFAQGSIDAVQALTQPADGSDDADGQSDDVVVDGADGSDVNAVANDGSEGSGEENGSTEGEDGGQAATGSESNGTESNDADNIEPNEDAQSDDADGQSDEDGIAPVSDGETSGSYNPGADAVDVSDDCTATVTFYKDASHTTVLGSTAVTSNETFYANLHIKFETKKPSLANPNVMYRFPPNVKVADTGLTDLMDDGTFAGTWYIENNVAYFKYYESYLNKDVTHAYVNLDCKLEGVNKGDGDSETVTFNGSSTSVTIYTKDGDVSGSKFGGDMSQTWNGPTYNQDDNSYTWTIKISPSAYATNVKIEDAIGSNLTFADGSFKLVDASGQEVSGQCDVTVSGQNATISLGDLTAGDYYVQYKTYVKSLPSTDNTAISNVNNKATYSWGASDNRKSKDTEKSPQEAKYSMVSKSADGSSTPSAIKWVVKLNNGSIKADMGGYTFTDELGSDQTFVTSTGVTVTDSDGNPVTVTDSSMTSSALTFKLPADAGKKQYTVTYYTQMTDTDSKDAVKNTAKVTPSDPTHGPEGEDTGTYNPPDHGTYITKTLTSTPSYSSYDGTASWKSEILFSDMAANTTPTSIEFKDTFSNLPNGVQVSLDGDVKLTIGDGGAALVEGTDYTITTKGDQATWGELIKINFKDSDTVRGLIGQAGAKVVVTYTTKTTQVSGEYPTGTYKNKSSVKTDKKNEVSAETEYTFEKEATPPAVIKKGVSTSWDADYSWSDGTKGAWITNWTAYVNRTSKSDGSAAVDLGGKDVTVTDSLPTNSELVASSAKYKLMDKGGYNGSEEQSIDFTSSDGIVTFVISTKDAKYSWGSDMGTQVSVVLTYQTATKGSVDSKDEITNTAQASSGSYAFPEGSDTVTVDNKALAKTGSAVSGSSAREYTITVNENAYDLVSDSDELTLVDDLDYRGELSASTISVKSAEGIDLLATGQASYELAKIGEGGNTHTRLTIKVPDSTKVIVTYKVVPSGKEGDLIENFSNSCSLSGVKSSATSVTQTFNVASSSGGTGSESWGITLVKYDSSGKKTLEGATFELWKVDLDNSTLGNIVAEKVDTQTSDASGKVVFGTKENPLVSNTLYYFVETVAPEGYEISYTGNTYVMLKSANTQSGYEAARKKAVDLKCTPSSATAYTAYDALSAGSFELNVAKVVEGGEAPKGSTFTFHAEATGDNKASAPTLADVTVTTDDTGEKTYDAKFTGTLSDSMNGQTFTYLVSETGTAPEGWTYDFTTYTATVEVVEKDGKLVGNVTYYKPGEGGELAPVDKMTFTNKYEVKRTTATIQANKKLHGRDMVADEFSFQLVDENEGETKGQVIDSASAPAASAGVEATVSFGALTYAEPGDYYYSVKEVKGDLANVTYDEKVYDVKVVVEENYETGDLSAKVLYRGPGETAYVPTVPTFVNTYTPATGSFALKVKKTVNGGSVRSGETFTFSATSTDEGAPKFDSVTTDANGEASFATVNLDESYAGKRFTYTIHEENDLPSPWAKAGDVTAVVSIGTKSSQGTISVSVTYDGNQTEAANFDNAYDASASVKLNVNKVVTGATNSVKDKEFTFALYGKGDSEASQTVTTKGSEDGVTASFAEALTFSAAGTYEYEIKELDASANGWTCAEPTTATVTVKENDDRSLTATVKYGRATTDGEAALFTNTYATSAELNLDIAKTVNGATSSSDKEFTFGLYETDAFGNKTGNPISTVKVKADGKPATFTGVTYDQDNDGQTITYVISETSKADKGWENAADQKVTVKVSDNGDGTMKAEVSYPEGSDSFTFDNTYEAANTAIVKVSKTVNGDAPAADQSFDFELQAVTAGAPMPAAGADKATTHGATAASFGDITYTLADAGKTYEYRIVETSKLGTGWTAASPLTVKVKVGADKGDGTLGACTVTYGDNAKATSGVMNNLFETGKATISVEKTVNGGPIAEGEKFTFTLHDSKGDQVGSEVTATKDNPTVSFDELTFDSVGTYVYTVHETTELADGWTNDDDITVTLTVGSVDGKFKVTRVSYGDDTRGYDKDGNYIVKFDDKYEAKAAKSEVKVEKTVNGGPIETGEKFTFTLLDADGNKVAGTDEITATKDNPTVSFGELEFAEAGTYTYTVHETSELGDGWTNDDDFTVTFTVELGQDRDLHVTNIAYGQRGYEADGSVVAKFDDKYVAPEVPEDKDEKGEGDKPKKQVPQTGDLYGALGTTAVCVAAAGIALVALGLRRSRR